MAKLIAYDFADRRKVICFKCGGEFREGRYREHLKVTNDPAHANDRGYSSKEKGNA